MLWYNKQAMHTCYLQSWRKWSQAGRELMEALLAVVMAARQHLGLRIVLVANGASDLLLQILCFDDLLSFSFMISHDP